MIEFNPPLRTRTNGRSVRLGRDNCRVWIFSWSGSEVEINGPLWNRQSPRDSVVERKSLDKDIKTSGSIPGTGIIGSYPQITHQYISKNVWSNR